MEVNDNKTEDNNNENVIESNGWNGEFESLSKEDWYSQIPDSIRPHLEKGLKNKYSNWDRGFQSKFQEAKRLKEEAQKDLELARTLFEGDVPDTGNFEKDLAALKEQLTSVERERDTYKTELDNMQIDIFQKQISTEYPDIYNHDDAFESFCNLLISGMPMEKAAKAAKALIDVEEEREIPQSIALSSRSSTTAASGGTMGETFEQAVARLKRQG